MRRPHEFMDKTILHFICPCGQLLRFPSTNMRLECPCYKHKWLVNYYFADKFEIIKRADI